MATKKEIEEAEKLEEQDISEVDYKDTKPDQIKLRTNLLINQYLCGVLDDLTPNYAKVILTCTEEMLVDKKGLIHTGFIFSAANFAAVAAVNVPNVVLAVGKANFLAPLALNDVVYFEANSQQSDTRKRVVEVAGYLGNVKIFDGEFSTVILDRHILSLHLS